MKITIVVPAYNEAKRIGVVLKELEKLNFPVIIVDDGSKDQTFAIINQYKVTPLRHRVNLGKGAALKTGCEAAFLMGAEAVIIMDSDGQHKIEDLPQFVQSLESEKYDMVFGTRNFHLGVPFVRFIGNKLASVFVSLLFGIYISDLICGYRAFNKKAYEKINWQSTGYGVETEMVIKTGKYRLRYCEVPVETVYFDKVKGVTILDAFNIFFDVLRWRVNL